MKIIHTILQTQGGENFFVVAEHDKKKILRLRVHKIVDEIVGDALPYTEKHLPEMVDKLESILE